MLRPVFGRKMASTTPPLPQGLGVVIVPRGAFDSAQTWSLAEALALFVDHAREDALFEPAELVADAVAVAAAYAWSGEIDSRLNGEWRERANAEEVEAVGRGLRLIGRNDVAAQLAGEFAPGRQPDILGLAADVSAWARSQPWLLVLGDGGKDRVYKEDEAAVPGQSRLRRAGAWAPLHQSPGRAAFRSGGGGATDPARGADRRGRAAACGPRRLTPACSGESDPCPRFRVQDLTMKGEMTCVL